MKTERTPFGEWLKGLREREGINQQEMAERMHYTRNYLSVIEHGHMKVSEDFIDSILCAFRITVDEYRYMRRLIDNA